MQLVERHLICKGDPRFAVIDQAAFASKKPLQSGDLPDSTGIYPGGNTCPMLRFSRLLKPSK